MKAAGRAQPAVHHAEAQVVAERPEVRHATGLGPRDVTVASANSGRIPEAMDGEGVVAFDYTLTRGERQSIPNALVELDLEPEGPTFAGADRDNSAIA